MNKQSEMSIKLPQKRCLDIDDGDQSSDTSAKEGDTNCVDDNEPMKEEYPEASNGDIDCVGGNEDMEEETSDDDNDSVDEGEDKEVEDSKVSEKGKQQILDPYSEHITYSLPEGFVSEKLDYDYEQFHLPGIGNVAYAKPKGSTFNETFKDEVNLSDWALKNKYSNSLKNNLLAVSISKRSLKKMSTLELNFYNLISDYVDVAFMQRTYKKGEALRKIYTIHALNHILRSREKIKRNDFKLSKNPDKELRDQGFTRPTVLMLVPFRNDCYRIVMYLMSLLPRAQVVNKKRFARDFGPPEPPKIRPEWRKKKPQDYDVTFEGNVDENFRIGLRIKNKKSVSLFTDFYSSDLIIASPLGLMQVIDNKGKKDTDFLSSIEILVIDKADVLYMQNLSYLLSIMKHLNCLPKDSHDTNFFRVRFCAVEGLSKYFRQTLLLSQVEHRWFEGALFRNFCFNYKGCVRSLTVEKKLGINQIFDNVKVCFRFFDFASPQTEFDDRFNFFVNKVLPEFRATEMAQTLIFIPSYYDFVRLRNHFRENEISAAMLCEYLDPGKVAENRKEFYNRYRHFMLYTERAHFYHRYHLKAVQHIIFYQPPTYPVFFKEMNFMLLDSHFKRKGDEKSCTVIASKSDILQLKHIIGMKEATRMLQCEQKVFVRYIEH